MEGSEGRRKIYQFSESEETRTVLGGEWYSGEDTFRKLVVGVVMDEDPSLTRLVMASDVETRVEAAAKRIPPDLLAALLKDSSPRVRATALANPDTDFQTFRDAVLGSALPWSQQRPLCDSPHVVKDVELFEVLWRVDGFDEHLLCTINKAVFNGHSDSIDSRVFGVVERGILSASNPARRFYAAGHVEWSRPEILDSLKDDTDWRVIHALSKNKRIWVSTQEHLLESNKTPTIQSNIATATGSNALLNKMYDSIPSVYVREVIERNPAFSAEWYSLSRGTTKHRKA